MSENFSFRPGKRPPPAADMPLYSLITIVRNAARTLERTLESVARQTYPAIEYIVVDAASTDGTVDILRRHEHLISHWCSEPDDGHADGANKGVRQATGRYIGFVYADDWLPDDFVEKTVAAFQRTGADFVFGDMNFYEANGDHVLTLYGDPNYKQKISYWIPIMNFPTLSAAACVYEKAGYYDPHYRVVPDNDWIFRIDRAGFTGAHDTAIVYNFTWGGHSSAHHRKIYTETAQSALRNGCSPWKVLPYALLKLAFHTVDHMLRRALPTSLYVRVRAMRKAITG